MQVARRVYLYLVSFISLWMVLSGATDLLRLILERVLNIEDSGFYGPDYLRNEFSRSAATLVVGAVVWGVHWFIAQRIAAAEGPEADDERRSVLRKLFLYGVMGLALVQVGSAISRLFTALMSPYWSSTSDNLALIVSNVFPRLVVYGIAGLYYWRVLRLDNATSSEEGRPATIRRWYLFLVSYFALSVLMSQLASLGRFLWQLATNPDQVWSPDGHWMAPVIASALPLIVVSGAIWLLHWNIAQHRMDTSEQEKRSTLRKVYLFAITLQTVAVTLGALAVLLNSILRMFWGSDPVGGTGEPILSAAGGPLVTALVYGAFWIYHRLVIRWDAAIAVSQPSSQIAIRQLYRYMVALIGLGFLAAGVVNMLRLLFDQLLGSSTIVSMSAEAWGDQISLVATTIVIGAVTWLATWIPSQREALAPGREADRSSLPRRLYLILVLFFSVTTLLGGAAWLLYQVLLYVGTPAGSWISDVSWGLAATITAGTLFAYHALTLRDDLRARPAPVAVVPPALVPVMPGTIMLLQADEYPALEAAVGALRSQVPEGIRAYLFHAPGIGPSDLDTWLASRTVSPAPDVPEESQQNLPPDPEPLPA